MTLPILVRLSTFVILSAYLTMCSHYNVYIFNYVYTLLCIMYCYLVLTFLCTMCICTCIDQCVYYYALFCIFISILICFTVYSLSCVYTLSMCFASCVHIIIILHMTWLGTLFHVCVNLRIYIIIYISANKCTYVHMLY